MSSKNRKQTGIIVILVLSILLVNCTVQNYAVQSIEAAKPTQGVTAIAMSVDSKPDLVHISGYEEITYDNFYQIKLLSELGAGFMFDVTISPDKSRLAVYTINGIHVYDSNSFNQISFLPINADINNTILFTPDNKKILYSLHNGVYQWDMKSQEAKHLFSSRTSTYPISNIIILSNSDRLVVVQNMFSSYCDGDTAVYSLYTLEGNLLFERYFCEYCSHNFIRELDRNNLLFANQFVCLANNSYFDISVVDPSSGILQASSEKQFPSDLEIKIGNQNLLPSFEQINSWDKEINKLINIEFNNYCPDFYNETIFPPKILSINNNEAILSVDSRVLLKILKINLSSCTIEKQISSQTSLNNWGFGDLIISPGSKYIATDDDINLYIWNTETLSLQQELNNLIRPDIRHDYIFNSDETKMIIQTGKNELSVLDTDSWNIINIIQPSIENIVSIHNSTDPNIVIINFGKGLLLWNICNNFRITDLPEGNFLLDPDRQGIWIAKNIGGKINQYFLYDDKNGTLLQTLKTNLIDIYKHNLLQEKSIIEVSGQTLEGNIVWQGIDINSEKVLWESFFSQTRIDIDNNDTSYISPHLHHQTTLGFSDKTGKYFSYIGDLEFMSKSFLISNSNGRLLIWNTNSGELITEIRLDYQPILIRMSSDSFFLSVVGDDGIIRVYGIKN